MRTRDHRVGEEGGGATTTSTVRTRDHRVGEEGGGGHHHIHGENGGSQGQGRGGGAPPHPR